jgi:Arc/MetJ-type ribon-helix-helix transcriptional regulator
MKKPKAAPKEAVLSVRIPLPLKNRLERRAKRNRVSQNSEIIHALLARLDDAERSEARTDAAS